MEEHRARERVPAELDWGCPDLLPGQKCSTAFSMYDCTCSCTCAPDVFSAPCWEESLPSRKQTDCGIKCPFGCCPEFPYCFLHRPVGFFAVSLKIQNSILLHHHILLCLCPGQHRQALLKGEAGRRVVLGLLWSVAAAVMCPDPFVLHCVWRTKKVQTENRKTKKDIIMLANFCGHLIGLKVYSAIYKC